MTSAAELYREAIAQFINDFLHNAEAAVPSTTLLSSKVVETSAMTSALKEQFAAIPRVSALLTRFGPVTPIHEADGIYAFYADAMASAEQKLEALLMKYLSSATALIVASAYLSMYGSRPELFQNAKVALERVAAPPPGALELWGSSGKKGALPDDSEADAQNVMRALASDIAGLCGVAVQKGGDDALRTTMRLLEDNSVAASEALTFTQYMFTLRRLVDASNMEQHQLVPQYEEDLKSVWTNMVEDYKALLLHASSVADLRDSLAKDVLERIRRSSDICETYRKAAPILQDVAGAPKKRNIAVLLATSAGEQLVQWYHLFRPILTGKDAVPHYPFMTEMHPLSGVLIPFETSREPMDRVHAALSEKASFGLAERTNQLMDSSYTTLRMQGFAVPLAPASAKRASAKSAAPSPSSTVEVPPLPPPAKPAGFALP